MYFTKNTQLTILKLGKTPKVESEDEKLVLQPFTEFIITEILDHKDKHLQVLAESDNKEVIIPNKPFWINYSQFDLSELPSEIFSVVPEDKLKFLFPKDIGCIPFLNQYMMQHDITERGSIWCFLATIAQETGGLRWLKQLKATDKYCGRGIIQLTGSANYQAFQNDTGILAVDQPELLEQPEIAVHSGCWFWEKHGLNKITAKYSIPNFERATNIVTGGRSQWSERITWVAKIKNYLK